MQTAQVIAFDESIKFINKIGIENVMKHESELINYGQEILRKNNSVKLIGNPKNKGGVLSFTLDGIHPHDIATILDEDGVAIRAGHHCCQILHDKLNISASARASLGIYNTKDDLDKLNNLSIKYNIPIIEDSACALGTEYKNKKIGFSRNIVTYSFQARKCLTTGEGGMIVVRNQEDAEWLKSYRAFGTNISPLKRDKANYLLKEQFDMIGTNYKMGDIPCSIGIAQLESFDEEIERRSSVGEYYQKKILEMKDNNCGVNLGIIIPETCTKFNWQNYHILLDSNIDRDLVVDKLRKRNIGCKWDIQAIHVEPAYNDNTDLPQTMKYHNNGMWLGFYAEITKKEQNYVIQNLKEVLNELR